jgi:hypothetical protein
MMKRFVGSVWIAGPAVGLLTVLAVGITGSGAGGAYLFGLAFVTIILLIKHRYESSPEAGGPSRSRTQ